MPITIPENIPASKTLKRENVFVMNERRAVKQDIRPLRIVILNLMPTKIVTETQLLRKLSNSPLQVEIELMKVSSYVSKNTSEEHLTKFYNTFDYYKDMKFDGMIITGAPVENMPFEEVDYWDELCEIMEWSKTHVTSCFHICWGAQAGLYYHYGINKKSLAKKMFGVFPHKVLNKKSKLLRGFDDVFPAPHSRHTYVEADDIREVADLEIMAESDEAGVYIVANKSRKDIFVMGHSEYDRLTLAEEYFRDVDKGLEIDVPKNYFPNDNPKKKPVVTWRSHGNLLYSNWLNYYVYQITPFDINKIK